MLTGSRARRVPSALPRSRVQPQPTALSRTPTDSTAQAEAEAEAETLVPELAESDDEIDEYLFGRGPAAAFQFEDPFHSHAQTHSRLPHHHPPPPRDEGPEASYPVSTPESPGLWAAAASSTASASLLFGAAPGALAGVPAPAGMHAGVDARHESSDGGLSWAATPGLPRGWDPRGQGSLAASPESPGVASPPQPPASFPRSGGDHRSAGGRPLPIPGGTASGARGLAGGGRRRRDPGLTKSVLRESLLSHASPGAFPEDARGSRPSTGAHFGGLIPTPWDPGYPEFDEFGRDSWPDQRSAGWQPRFLPHDPDSNRIRNGARLGDVGGGRTLSDSRSSPPPSGRLGTLVNAGSDWSPPDHLALQPAAAAAFRSYSRPPHTQSQPQAYPLHPPWKPALYLQQPYPDNYVDASFLSALVTNANVRNRNLSEIVFDSVAITQRLSLLIIFLIVFYRTLVGALPWPPLLVADLALLLAGVFSGILRRPVRLSEAADAGIAPRPRRKGSAPLTPPCTSVTGAPPKDPYHQARRLVLFVGVLFLLSPLLETLTRAISSDTIWLFTLILCAVHLVYHDYGFVSDPETPFHGTISLNAAVFASVLLASRLQSMMQVFSVVLFAFELFAGSPLVARQVKARSTVQHLAFTAAVTLVALGLLWAESRFLGLCLLLAIVFITLVCPFWLKWIQRFKNEIQGPWDITTGSPSTQWS